MEKLFAKVFMRLHRNYIVAKEKTSSSNIEKLISLII